MTNLTDFGQTIGGARKDLPVAKRRTDKSLTNSPATTPPWRRKYEIVTIQDKFSLRRNGSLLYRFTFPTKTEAEAAIPLIEVSRKHRVMKSRKIPGQFAIWKQINQRQWGEIKTGFTTEEEAKAYLLANIPTILAFRSADPERPHLDKLTRHNATHPLTTVTTADFQSTFAFRGGQFGNWNYGNDGQAALNQGYWALWDLAEILGVTPATLSLSGDLAIAFGARGHGGKNSSQAHYERGWAVINLTKMSGHGNMAHEMGHALDHWLARKAGLASSEREYTGQFKTRSIETDYLSHHIHFSQSQLPPSLNNAFKSLCTSLIWKTILKTPDPEQIKKGVDRYQSELADSLSLLTSNWLDGTYNRRFTPPTTEQQDNWHAAVQLLQTGNWGEPVVAIPAKGLNFDTLSYAPLQTLDTLYYAAHKRRFIRTGDCPHTRLVTLIKLIEATTKEYHTALSGTPQTVKVRTDFYTNAKELDSTRSEGYYATPHEMFARAFEAFIQDELTRHSRTSDYLVYAADNRFYFDCKPYPESEEREAFNEAFRELFRVMRSDFTQHWHPDLPAIQPASETRNKEVVEAPTVSLRTPLPFHTQPCTQLSLF